MATVGVIDLFMRASTDDFIAGLTKASKAVDKFAANAVKVGAGIGAGVLAGAAAGVAGAAYELQSLTRTAFDTVVMTGRAADRLGLTTEAFSGLAFGAKKSGLEISEFATMLGKMHVRLVEVASTGAGAAKPAIDLLGIDAGKLAKGRRGVRIQGDRGRVEYRFLVPRNGLKSRWRSLKKKGSSCYRFSPRAPRVSKRWRTRRRSWGVVFLASGFREHRSGESSLDRFRPGSGKGSGCRSHDRGVALSRRGVGSVDRPGVARDYRSATS